MDLAASLDLAMSGGTWDIGSSLPVDGDVGHPQGLLPWADNWLVSTVHLEPVKGEVMVIDDGGAVIERVEVTDGERIHPGGMATARSDGWVVAVAEYRPDSTTTIVRLDHSLDTTEITRFEDHLGAICELDDGTFFAVSWGSRRFYRLDANGRVLQQRNNPSYFVDHQDLTVVDATTVIATGVGGVPAPSGRVQLGGVTVIDVDDLVPVREAPLHAWMPSGRVATYNGAHLDSDEGLRLHCIVDDREAALVTWLHGTESRPRNSASWQT